MVRRNVEGVLKAVEREVKQDRFGDAWESVDALSESSPARALELATRLLQLGLSTALPERQRATRENIFQAGREGWNPANIKIFGHLQRVSQTLFGGPFISRDAEARAPQTFAALPRATAEWTDEMLWTFLRSFATNAGSLKKRPFVPKLLEAITPTEPGGPGAMFLNNLRGVKNARKPSLKKPKAAPESARPVAVPPAAVLSALREKPDDATSLAVFADWLVEQGDPTAELLQLELALATRPRDAALLKARRAWLAAHPASPCLTLERRLGLPRAATFEFTTGKAAERAALASFLASPAAQLIDTLRVECGRVQPFKPVVEALKAARPLHVTTFELSGQGRLDADDLFSLKTFPRLARLKLVPHQFAQLPRISIPTLAELTIGVSRHNGPLAVALASADQLRRVSLHTAFIEAKFLAELLRGKWALTALGLFAWGQPELWERLQASPVFASLKEVGATWDEEPPPPKGKTLMKDLW